MAASTPRRARESTGMAAGHNSTRTPHRTLPRMWSASERYIGTLASLRSPRDRKVTQGALTKHNRGVAERCEMAVQPEYNTMDKSDIDMVSPSPVLSLI